LSVLLLTSGLSNGYVLCVEKDGNSAVEVATGTGHCSPCINGNRPQDNSVIHASDCGCTDVPLADGCTYLSSKNQPDSLEVVITPLVFVAFASLSLEVNAHLLLPQTARADIALAELLVKRSTVLLI